MKKQDVLFISLYFSLILFTSYALFQLESLVFSDALLLLILGFIDFIISWYIALAEIWLACVILKR